MIWMIPALVFAAGCLAVAGWALREMYRHKRAYGIANASVAKYLAERDEALRLFDGVQLKLDGMAIAIRDQAQRNAQVVTEYDTLLVKYGGLEERIDELLLDNTALLDVAHNLDVEVGKLKLELDEALRPKVPAVDGAVKKPRVSRAKPPLAE